MSVPAWAEMLLESTPAFVIVTNSDRQIVGMSAVARRRLSALRPMPRTLGDIEDAAGKPIADGTAPASAALQRRGAFQGELTLPDPDGGLPTTYELTIQRFPEGGTMVLAVDKRDVTTRVQAERDRAATEEYLARLGHELRTPLNAVLGFAQLLELENLGDDAGESVQRILTAGRHMATLLDEVLDLARVRGGGVDLDVGPVPVLEVVRGVLDLAQPQADARSITRTMDPAEPVVALADRTRLWQVVLNLVSNAVKYGRDGGEVRVGVRSVGPERLRIEVVDDGPGLPEGSLTRLFRPFERLGADKTGIEGTGLGLALSHALVTAMGGTLSATSTVGGGTTMTVDLVALDADLAAGEPRRAARTIVHVSGDQASHALVAQALRSRLGAQSLPVRSAQTAASAVLRAMPALVLVDDELPDGSGAELLQLLASQPETALIPVVVLAQDAEDRRVAVRLRGAGAAAVLDLPLNVRELLRVVGRYLDRADAG
ncbi:MAG TPA: hybrid sensor histidine kinase/response regulator [Mycobacteriales bacterium]|nr:hybrid sensor histidine kinase/response regulator [Mycobacteriales bacterium]